jgi:hypothetical protein
VIPNQADVKMNIRGRPLIIFFLVVFVLVFNQRLFADSNIVVGKVRVQLLSKSLVRIELKGPEGFEDRSTFHIVNRDWPGTSFTTNVETNEMVIRTADYLVRVPQNATSLNDLEVDSPAGKTLYKYDGILTNSVWLPGPSDNPQVWSFADTPRIVPPAWGLTPPPKPMANGGWDLNNDAQDIYVFIPHCGYRQLRSNFLKLTGPTEMPPLFAFGAFDSRYYSYSETTALKQIDDYRAHGIPLDTLVVDTGWRVGASIGYQPDTNLFPNMSRFLQEAHDKHVHVMFNDHPEPKSANALDATELNYRYDNLTGLLNEGLDFWWYDRNWSSSLKTPAANLKKEVWGMRLYHDTTLRDRPDLRPLIMANVDGIDGGIRNRPMDVAAHLYSIQWTGDSWPGFDFLRNGVENAVHAGVCSAFPYMSEDLGGHLADPTPEGYIRWIEYGALSPIYRPHCTYNHERMPWAFGPEAETVARRFVNMRYRLLPVFYAAAHENYETGEPLLRRLDLDYPKFSEASRDDEYLLGHGILVAPVLQSSIQVVPDDWFTTQICQPGLLAEYFTNQTISGMPAFRRTDANINFNWDNDAPAPDFPRTYFSVRWMGCIQVPASVGDVKLAALEDDGVRVWIDGTLVIDAWGPHDSTTTEAATTLSAGVPHQIRVEYQQLDGKARIKLLWESAGSPKAAREAWIPPGDWIDVWNGQVISGPTTVTNNVPLDEIPMWIKSGTVLPLAPEMKYTGEKPWDPISLDLYPGTEAASTTLYEDDTLTTDYQKGEFRTTAITATANTDEKAVSVQINAAQGDFNSALTKRSWVLRIHLPPDWPKDLTVAKVTINGENVELMNVKLSAKKIPRCETAMPFGDSAGAPDGDVFEQTLPINEVSEAMQVKINFQE